MHARVSTLDLDPARIDETLAMLEEEELPKIRGQDGFKGFTALVDRSSGKVVGTSYWTTQEQMQASEAAGQSARQHAAETGAAKGEPQVERFEVAIDTFVQ
jgi:heme-degrading monooxygenase HmoA